MNRLDGRGVNENRPVRITRHFIKYAEGSVLIEVGDTKVICTATVEDKVPPFLKGQGKGWVSAEYGMLPRATQVRTQRDSTKGKINGRALEIQRLIGRALRSVVDLSQLGERTIWIDCDVIQADGGTRTASITGGFVALVDALYKMKSDGILPTIPIHEFLAAVSVGVVDETPLLDLAYDEDSRAKVDMNVVMTESGKIVEIQGTGEGAPFTREEMEQLMVYAQNGIKTLIAVQRESLRDLALPI